MPEAEVLHYRMEPVDVLALSILVLFLGLYLNRKIDFLRRNFIPPAVSGGLICAGVVALLKPLADLEVSFDLRIRDVLLLVFFSTIGLSAKFNTLIVGGKALAILVAIAAVFLAIQDITGIGFALALGVHPGYGLMAGSVSLAGGHGTSIAWGAQAEAAGLVGASTVGLAFATFGLIAGGLLGGPVAGYLMRRHNLKGPDEAEAEQAEGEDQALDPTTGSGDLFHILTAILVLAICVSLGNLVNERLFARGVLLPGFLTAMAIGICITNLSDVLRFKIHPKTIEKFGEVSLNIFLAMSLMTMNLLALAGGLTTIMLVLMAQALVITLFSIFIVFRLMGRDYDAAVISAGFMGLGLGATPVAIANMDVLTRRFGPSTKAFLVVPLVGAFFIDILNAIEIKFFIEVITRWLT